MENSTFIQRFFWSVAGVEKSILEQETCKADRTKYEAIGAAIAMTSFMAFLSGTAAAWYFTQRGSDTSGNIGWAMAFGVVWSTLIFCIDRSLVITMKKNLENDSKTWWIMPLASRTLLALIIAFMVSIPLELVVFEDLIAEQQFLYNENNSNRLAEHSRAHRGAVEAQGHIDDYKETQKKLEKQGGVLNKERDVLQYEQNIERSKLNNPTTVAFREARKGLNTANSKIANLRKQLSYADDKQKHTIISQINNWQSKKNSYNATIKKEIEKWNVPIHERINELDAEIQNKDSEIAQNKQHQANTINSIEETEKHREELEQSRDSIVNAHDNVVSKGNHFIQNFEILEYAVSRKELDCTTCNGKGKVGDKQCTKCYGKGKIKTDLPEEWYFLWLIRLLFFIIELLPTVVKIAMPVTSYDKIVHANAKDLDEYLSSLNYRERIRAMHEMEIKSKEEQQKKVKEAEAEIRKALMEELKQAQQDIATAAVRKWREEELRRIALEGLDKKDTPSSTLTEDGISHGDDEKTA